MQIPEYFKWIGVLVAAGVVTGVTLHFVTGYLTAQAQTAARAEVQRTWTLIMESANAKTQSPKPPAPQPEGTYTMM